MLKYQDILNSLTIEQKLALIADFTALGSILQSEHGFKFISAVDVKDAKESAIYPTLESLINSWSVDLIRKVSDDITARLKKSGVTLMGLPGAKVKATPYAKGYTEDPMLATEFAVQYALTSERAGIGTYITEPYLTAEEVSVSDVNLNERAVNEYFLRPINTLLKNKITAVCLKDIPSTGAYFKANEELNQKIVDTLPIIKENVTAEQTMEYSCSEKTFARNGAVTALKEAYSRYLEYRKAFESGEISLADVETACRSGNALSPDMIDLATERILDFSATCNNASKKASMVNTERNLQVRSVEESIVMLKNENKTLPLKRSSVALIGELSEFTLNNSVSLKKYLETQGAKFGIKLTGFSKGYEGYKIIDRNLIDQAINLARKSDVILLMLGRDPKEAENERKNHNTILPANQVALVNELKKLGKKIIGVIYGDCPDMSFDNACSAVLLAPSVGLGASEGLVNVLSGIVSPGGRLANTCYKNTDEYFDTLRKYKNTGRNEVGTFFGYRYYQTAGLKVKYPFGFGLTYSKFSYYGLRIDANKISLCVRNIGRYSAHEVVQLYVGKKDSSIIRPQKELKAFKKVFLRPGKSERIVFEIKDLDLAVFDLELNSMVSERGTYEIYVGGNVLDDKLTGKININGRKLGQDGKKLTDYFQNMTNIHDKEYHLDVPMKIPKESSERRRKCAYVMSVVMICLAIIYMYMTYVGWVPNYLILHIVVGAITALPILFSIILTRAKISFINKHMEVSRKMKKENREKLNVEDLMEEVPFEELFEEEFKEEEVAFYDEEETAEIEEEIVVKKEVFDEELTLSVVQNELNTFLAERGIVVDPVSLRSITAGFASSRLIVLHSDDKILLEKFIDLLGDYLGSQVTVDNFESIHEGGDDILVSHGSNGTATLTNVATALTQTSVDDEKIRIMALLDATCDALKPCLAQVFKYIDAPEKSSQIYVRTDYVDDHYKMPENVWFVVTLAEGEKITDIPKYILDTACVIDLAIREAKDDKKKKLAKKVDLKSVVAENGEDTSSKKTDVVDGVDFNLEVAVEQSADISENVENIEDEKTQIKELLFYQFIKLVSRAVRDYQLEENLWKRVDKLEDYVCQRQNYKLDNKLWHRMEKFVSAYLASGGVPEEALDSVVAHHVVYGMLPIIATSREKNDDKFTHTIENIFGEGHAPYTVKVVKSTGLNV